MTESKYIHNVRWEYDSHKSCLKVDCGGSLNVKGIMAFLGNIHCGMDFHRITGADEKNVFIYGNDNVAKLVAWAGNNNPGLLEKLAGGAVPGAYKTYDKTSPPVVDSVVPVARTKGKWRGESGNLFDMSSLAFDPADRKR